ncbi:MAG: hypothetical protein NVS3B21_01060 [Acidimicrobiales bacterium]
MVVVGLTGGIGAGKSTVAGLLAARGAAIIDADVIARWAVSPGQPALARIAERFGDGVIAPDGTLDRPALAAVVFGDDKARVELEQITHPVIQAEIARQTLEHAGTDRIVVLDIPLLKERRDPMAGVIVVDVPPDIAVERLVKHRGFAERDARARIAAQISREARRALADVLIDNSGDEADLEAEVERAWQWARSLSPGDGPTGR